jgi:predicted ABC-type ATPase
MPPSLWIVAGPNGAGKTTCVQRITIAAIIPSVRILNPDDRTLAKLRSAGFQGFADAPVDLQTRCFLESADEVSAELDAAIEVDETIGVETVLSSDKYRPLVERARSKGGFVGLVYIALSTPALARDRVAARVSAGGHGVPSAKITERWQRSLDCLAWFAARASVFWVVDNSDSDFDSQPRLVATGQSGRLTQLSRSAFPEILTALATLPREPDADIP